jgi:glycosyltransferase involved in cell wall biosynthesis
VIATPHSAIPEVVTHEQTGLLTKEKDASSLAEMMEKIREAAVDVSSIRTDAREHIEQFYGINRMVTNIEDLYKKVIAS